MVDIIELELLKVKLEKLNKHVMNKKFILFIIMRIKTNYNITNNGTFIALNLLKQCTIDKINIHLNKINYNDVLNHFKKNNKIIT